MCSAAATTSNAATLSVNNCCVPDMNNNGAANVDDLLAVINAMGRVSGTAGVLPGRHRAVRRKRGRRR